MLTMISTLTPMLTLCRGGQESHPEIFQAAIKEEVLPRRELVPQLVMLRTYAHPSIDAVHVIPDVNALHNCRPWQHRLTG